MIYLVFSGADYYASPYGDDLVGWSDTAEGAFAIADAITPDIALQDWQAIRQPGDPHHLTRDADHPRWTGPIGSPAHAPKGPSTWGPWQVNGG